MRVVCRCGEQLVVSAPEVPQWMTNEDWLAALDDDDYDRIHEGHLHGESTVIPRTQTVPMR